MKVKVIMPPWCKPSVTKEFEEAVKIIGDDVWKEASIRFYAVRKAKINNGRSAPKGMQNISTKYWMRNLKMLVGKEAQGIIIRNGHGYGSLLDIK